MEDNIKTREAFHCMEKLFSGGKPNGTGLSNGNFF